MSLLKRPGPTVFLALMEADCGLPNEVIIMQAVQHSYMNK